MSSYGDKYKIIRLIAKEKMQQKNFDSGSHVALSLLKYLAFMIRMPDLIDRIRILLLRIELS